MRSSSSTTTTRGSCSMVSPVDCLSSLRRASRKGDDDRSRSQSELDRRLSTRQARNRTRALEDRLDALRHVEALKAAQPQLHLLGRPARFDEEAADIAGRSISALSCEEPSRGPENALMERPGIDAAHIGRWLREPRRDSPLIDVLSQQTLICVLREVVEREPE